MTAKIIPFPSQNRVRLVPIDADQEYLPPGVRALLEIMEATECKYGSIMPPKNLSMDDQIRLAFPSFVRPQ